MPNQKGIWGRLLWLIISMTFVFENRRSILSFKEGDREIQRVGPQGQNIYALIRKILEARSLGEVLRLAEKVQEQEL